MKKIFLLVFAAILSTAVFAQTAFKPYKAGFVFDISLPDYMSKAVNLNNAASFQFQNKVKDVYGFVIVDSKEELGIAQLQFSSAQEFYDNFIGDFLKDQEKRVVSASAAKKVGVNSFVSADASYFDKELQAEIYYFVGVVETPKAFYKVLCWSAKDVQATFKPDFEKIFYSVKD